MSRAAVWGVLNVTPDSFSDGGLYLEPGAALERARQMLAEGADVIDVGGESSRPAGREYGPGAEVVGPEEELRRVVPVVERLCGELGATVSVDTVKPEVARAALRAGARIVNDVSNGRSDGLLRAAAEAGAELVLMHNRGRGEVTGDNVRYRHVVSDVVRELLAAVGRAEAAGVPPDRVWIDPGLGFAKNAEQSLSLLAGLHALVDTGQRVLVGASRKSFLAAAAERNGSRPPPAERLGGSLAAVALAVMQGAHAVRVHDVAASLQAVRVAERVRALRGDG